MFGKKFAHPKKPVDGRPRGNKKRPKRGVAAFEESVGRSKG